MLAMAAETKPERLKPVYCVCGRFLCKASGVVEVKCPSCKRVIVAQMGEE